MTKLHVGLLIVICTVEFIDGKLLIHVAVARCLTKSAMKRSSYKCATFGSFHAFKIFSHGDMMAWVCYSSQSLFFTDKKRIHNIVNNLLTVNEPTMNTNLSSFLWCP